MWRAWAFRFNDLGYTIGPGGTRVRIRIDEITTGRSMACANGTSLTKDALNKKFKYRMDWTSTVEGIIEPTILS